MNRFRKIKRPISFALLICIFFINLFSVYVDKVYAYDATKLQTSYINLMRGGKVTSKDVVDGITNTEDLRFLSLFLSNAYVPFISSLDDPNSDGTEEKMASLLKMLGFDEDAAKTLCKMVMQASLDSCSQLYVRKADLIYTGVEDYGNGMGSDGGDTDEDPSQSKLQTQHSGLAEFGMSGRWDRTGVFYSPETFSNAEYKKIVRDTLDDNEYTPLTLNLLQAILYSCSASESSEAKHGITNRIPIDVYYVSKNGLKVAWTIDKDFTQVLRNMVALLDTSVVKEGYALNAFSSAKLQSMWNYDDDLQSFSKMENLLSLFQNVYVDWVGNIVVDIGTKRVVVCPAYLNNKTFTTVDGQERTNLVGVLPIIWLTTPFLYSIEGDKYIYQATDDTKFHMSYVESVGNSVAATLDKKWWIGEGDVKGFATALTDTYGFVHDEGLFDKLFKDNDTFVESEVYWYCYNGDKVELDGGNTLHDLIFFDSAGGFTGDQSSVFLCKDLLVELPEQFATAFSGTSQNFKGSGENYDYIISFNSSTDKVILQQIYLTYLFSYCNKGESVFSDSTKADGTRMYVDMKFNDIFPELKEGVTWAVEDTTSEEVLSFIYYLLHPQKGAEYVATWFMNKVSAIFIGWHEDVVGSSNANASTGMTQYLGFTGYVTTPSLGDIDWVASLLSNYNSIVVYLIILMSIILLCYVLIGSMTMQRGVIGFFLFAVLAFLPPVAINTVVNIINRCCDTIYSSKFDYWAITQIQTYLGYLSDMDSAENVNDYYSSLLNTYQLTSSGEGGSSETGYGGTKLKWISPKKYNELSAFSDEIQRRINASNSGLSSTIVSIATTGQANVSGGESYIASDTVGYLYRDILDVYKYAAYSYNIFTTFGGVDSGTSKFDNIRHWYLGGADAKTGVRTVSRGNPDRYRMLGVYVQANDKAEAVPLGVADTSSIRAIERGFLYPTVDTGSVKNYFSPNNCTLASGLGLNWTVSGLIHLQLEKLESIVSGGKTLNISSESLKESNWMQDNCSIYGIPTRLFNMGMSDFINRDSDDLLDYFYYGLYSESPFYYFNYNIRDQINAASLNYNFNHTDLTSSRGHIKNLFLDGDQRYFYNLEAGAGDGYGELRDFMNFHDFFYYIIPSLQEGNTLVNLWGDTFGVDLYEDCSIKVTNDGKILFDGKPFDTVDRLIESDTFRDLTDEGKYKLWHNLNVRYIYNVYTPWLNLMSTCNYCDSERIEVSGGTYVVTDPIDPTSYFRLDSEGNMVEGRYMVFSRSEMAYYGLTEADLTRVEKKLIDIQDNVYREAISLMNYYTLSDETLITALSFIELFEFNKEFSQSSIVGKDYTLYPQGYELKAFTYDAYLRLIISGSSGDALMTDGSGDSPNISIYRRVMDKTSIFFGIVLLVNDFVAVYLIPALKLFFLVVIFLLSIFMIVSSAVKLEMNIVAVTWKSLIAPLLSFSVVSVGMAYIVSLFMSNGAEGVTKTSLVISLGDPTMVMIVMTVINVGVLVLYWKICRFCFKDAMKFGRAILASVGGAVAGVASRMVGMMTQGRMMRRAMERAIGSHSTPEQRGKDNLPKSGKRSLQPALTGSGVQGGQEKGSSAGESERPNKYDLRSKVNDSVVNGAERNYNRSEFERAKSDIKRERAERTLARREERIMKQERLASESGDSVRQLRLQNRLEKVRARGERRSDVIASKGKRRADKYERRGDMLLKDGLNGTKVAELAGRGLAGAGKRAGKIGVSAVATGVNATAGALRNVRDYGVVGGTMHSVSQAVGSSVGALRNVGASGVRAINKARMYRATSRENVNYRVAQNRGLR